MPLTVCFLVDKAMPMSGSLAVSAGMVPSNYYGLHNLVANAIWEWRGVSKGGLGLTDDFLQRKFVGYRRVGEGAARKDRGGLANVAGEGVALHSGWKRAPEFGG